MTMQAKSLSVSDVLGGVAHGTEVTVVPSLDNRNRLTCAFRPILAIPHLLLVGGPVAFGITIGWRAVDGPSMDWGAGTGVLGLAAAVIALIAWFAILFTGEYPRGLWNLVAFYVRWRVRAMAYIALLRDEYPPFGDEDYPAHVDISQPSKPRNRLTCAFRILLLIPHFIVLWLLSVLWLITCVVAWFSILFTGEYPRSLYAYGVSVLRWSARVEAYLLLLHDEYPPFALE
jgi:hypothetical protein